MSFNGFSPSVDASSPPFDDSYGREISCKGREGTDDLQEVADSSQRRRLPSFSALWKASHRPRRLDMNMIVECSGMMLKEGRLDMLRTIKRGVKAHLVVIGPGEYLEQPTWLLAGVWVLPWNLGDLLCLSLEWVGHAETLQQFRQWQIGFDEERGTLQVSS
ncbi:uncharacterized protein LAESUDRAFT_713504 [Laetiporus sulphureus 93-53]|uniref:Uncharacterized protein n=1 Tax=Laetiporus sulphureus 93-53 TaxID=1314785 RepID=A0A165EMR8_9APHY|nr:uncharacterized protein LAESUDRAFT_713504 [Laetiporus sulphureus 93-53]KZT07389.1 hypothetical protein LAESUDRAFT_713504 [Laetiporus sulphureus 93-53]